MVERKVWTAAFVAMLLMYAGCSKDDTGLNPISIAGNWTGTTSMNVARWLPSAVLMADGKVLVAGGLAYGGDRYNSSEIFDLATGVWTMGDSMSTASAGTKCILLRSGRVLLISDPCELFDPLTERWSVTGSLSTPVGDFTATLLQNGKVLVTGGRLFSQTLATCEVYDPASGSWLATGSLQVPRLLHDAVLLPNGKVLVTGGYGPGMQVLQSVELYDPAAGTWTLTDSMIATRASHTSTLLQYGKVLVAGGVYSTDTTLFLITCELYDVQTGRWTPTGSMTQPAAFHFATALGNHKVLVTRDFSDACDLYDEDTGTWSQTGYMKSSRHGYSTALLPNGSLLAVGGLQSTGSDYITLASAEIYTP